MRPAGEAGEWRNGVPRSEETGSWGWPTAVCWWRWVAAAKGREQFGKPSSIGAAESNCGADAPAAPQTRRAVSAAFLPFRPPRSWYGAPVRILWASPLPPVRSGVADYAAELLPELSRLAEVRVVAAPVGDGPEPGTRFAGCPVVAGSVHPDDGEIHLVHLGNNPYHGWLLDRLAMPRTSVVLHDAVLHHLLVEATLAVGDDRRFEGMLLEAHPDAEALVRARAVGALGSRDPFLFPARRAFLQGVAAVLVHSRWAEAQVNRDLPELAVARVCLAVADPGPIDRAAIRQSIGVAGDETLVMHLGYLTPEKGLGDLLGAVAVARRQGVAARLFVVGEGGARGGLEAVARELGIADAVTFSGWVDNEVFCRLPAAADLGVVLRSPSAGETSAAVLRFLACGTPVAVTGVRQFLEWPQLAAPRVTPGPAAMAELARLLAEVRVAGDWPARRAGARAAYESGHRPADAARQMVRAISRVG